MIWGGKKKLVATGSSVSVFILGLIFIICILTKQEAHHTPTPEKRLGKADQCLSYYGGIEVDYVKGSTTAFTFDLCEVINCQGENSSWRGFDVWACYSPAVDIDCVEKGWTNFSPLCSGWGNVRGYTGPYWTPHQLKEPYKTRWSNFKIQRDFSPAQNPITISIGGWPQTPASGTTPTSPFYLILGVDITGRDPYELVKIIFKDSKPSEFSEREGAQPSNNSGLPSPVQQGKKRVVTVDYTQLKPVEVIERATGYKDSNLWLDWIIQNAKEQQVGDCVACATARLHLFTEPAPLHPEDTWGFNCMIGLTQQATPTNCTTLASIFPPIDNNTKIGPFSPRHSNYTCFNFTATTATLNYGNIEMDWCKTTLRDTHNRARVGQWARAGLYYYCGGNRLSVRIPQTAIGTCAMVRLGVPLVLIGDRLVKAKKNDAGTLTRKRRRHVLDSRSVGAFDQTAGSPTYIDAIGVPRGVPDEYKLVDQIASGFENIPIISTFFPVTPNKNVDRINYVHYNVLRLANLTRDAIEGLAEQVAPTSLMAVQNRMALDMLLAEKGGVCAMFGDMCCTFIPNNSAPDGSVTRALEGLKTLSKTMHEHSGVDNLLEEWMTSVFGKWKGFILSIMVSVATFGAILITCGC